MPTSEMVLSPGCCASTLRTNSSAISARVTVAEIGASSVTERVTERRSAKRTRTVTVRPGRDLARNLLATLSARRRSVGIKTVSSAGFLPSADCAPAECARRWVLISRGSRFHASKVSLSDAAGPSSRSSDHPANKFSRDCRALIETSFYKRVFPRTRINPRKSTETEFETTKRGSRLATSVGGTLTGRGADILIVDDPIKANDANSRVALEAANEWFRNTAVNRLNNPAQSLVVLTQQRLHTNDLSGILIESRWPNLVIPAVATESQDYAVGNAETYHRPAEELLQPNRDSAQTLEDIKREVGSRIFGAQYQQNPTPPDGNMIKASWLQRYTSAPPRDKLRSVVLSCDPAGKAGIKNDYTAITVVGIDAKELYLLHVDRGHWTVCKAG
jgi:hypothetical protein